MSDRSQSFGQAALRAVSPPEFLALEERHGRHAHFIQLDVLVEDLLRRALNGEQLIAFDRVHGKNAVSILGLNAEQRALVDEHFVLAQQQATGSWSLPEEAALDIGEVNLAFHFRAHPRFATGIAGDERGKVKFHGSTDALFIWSVLEPLFGRLFLPFHLRGDDLGKKDRDWQLTAWGETDAFLNALGFDVSEALAPLRYGGGWSKLRAPEQLRAKQVVMQSLVKQASRPHAARYRAFQVHRLLSRYYQQAKKGSPKRQQVLTKDFQRVLAGFFGGDWLSFLAYMEEAPHPDERIATALPETRLMVVDKNRVAAAAEAHGLPIEEVQRAVASFWGTDQNTSPVEERLEAMRNFWREFDGVHARQRPGMPPLWGLVDDGRIQLSNGQPYRPGLYRTLFSGPLLQTIDRLWANCMLARWPERVVSALSPHSTMAESFGAALNIWHGCALTAWFICEGPSSRTDLAGLGDYYRNDLTELERLGCPIDPSLFAELTEAESRLGPPEPMSDAMHATHHEIASGIDLAISVSSGIRRDGFEHLRDIISRYRGAWCQKYLGEYLRGRWETEVRDAARDFHLIHERKGKPPTLKEFAPHAVLPTNHWFGGDITQLYRMIGEKSPVEAKHRNIMPVDRAGFVRLVLDRLNALPGLALPRSSGAGGHDARERDQERWNLQWLAEESLLFLQLEEALGRPPTLDELGRERFEYRAVPLAPEMDKAWDQYQQAIWEARRSFVSTTDGSPSDGTIPHSHVSQDAGSYVDAPSPGGSSAATPEFRTERKPFWKRLFGGDKK